MSNIFVYAKLKLHVILHEAKYSHALKKCVWPNHGSLVNYIVPGIGMFKLFAKRRWFIAQGLLQSYFSFVYYCNVIMSILTLFLGI